MSEMYNADNLFEQLSKNGVEIDEQKKRLIQDKISRMLNYEPRIGIFGKTGAGKSSLCNALFGREVCEISDVAACTRNPQEVILNIAGGKGMNFMQGFFLNLMLYYGSSRVMIVLMLQMKISIKILLSRILIRESHFSLFSTRLIR